MKSNYFIRFFNKSEQPKFSPENNDILRWELLKLALKNEEIYKLFNIKSIEFPKYTTQLMNLANQNSQGTRPKIVGQLSELIQVFEGETFEDWVSWYEKNHPTAISNAASRIVGMVENLKKAIQLIDDIMIEKWVKDLVHNKTFFGLKIQNIILKKLAEDLEVKTRLATPKEESNNIDGFIDKTPVQIKPITYKQKQALPEEINIDILYYDKKKDRINFEIPDKFYNIKKQTYL